MGEDGSELTGGGAGGAGHRSAAGPVPVLYAKAAGDARGSFPAAGASLIYAPLLICAAGWDTGNSAKTGWQETGAVL